MEADDIDRDDPPAHRPAFPPGTPTAIGSLPHLDREAAVAEVLERFPELPAAPSLPALDRREGMVAQAAWGIRGVDVGPDGSLTVDPGALEPGAPLTDPELDGPPFATLRAFLAAVAGRTDPIKVQLTGPVTLGLALRRAGVADELAYLVAGGAVRERAGHIVAAAMDATVAPVVAFVDEPGLGCGPGGRAPDLGLAAEAVTDLVSGALATLESSAVTGLHCCGSTDWRTVIQAGPDVLSVPVDAGPVAAGLIGAAGALIGFLERGGWVAWGAVPTDGPVGEGAARPWRVLSALWCELEQAGCDPVRLRRQGLITPACGLGLHGLDQAGAVLDLTRLLADRLRHQVVGTKFSVGA